MQMQNVLTQHYPVFFLSSCDYICFASSCLQFFCSLSVLYVVLYIYILCIFIYLLNSISDIFFVFIVVCFFFFVCWMFLLLSHSLFSEFVEESEATIKDIKVRLVDTFTTFKAFINENSSDASIAGTEELDKAQKQVQETTALLE